MEGWETGDQRPGWKPFETVSADPDVGYDRHWRLCGWELGRWENSVSAERMGRSGGRAMEEEDYQFPVPAQ